MITKVSPNTNVDVYARGNFVGGGFNRLRHTNIPHLLETQSTMPKPLFYSATVDPSNLDTNGIEERVHISEVSSFLGLSIFGKEKVFVLEVSRMF